MKRIIVGGVCRDTFLSVSRLGVGEKHLVRTSRSAIGGGGANEALATRALARELRILLFAHTGDDRVGSEVRQRLEQHRIEMPLAPLDNVPTSESMIVSEEEEHGRGTILSLPGARARDLPLDSIQAELAGADALYLCGPSQNHQIAPLLAMAREACVPSYFALGSAQIQRLRYPELQRQLGPTTELVICNRQEAAKLTGKSAIVPQLRALRFGGRARAAVVTCGGRGLWGLDNLGAWYQGAYRDSVHPIVSDTGAGDAAAAAIFDALLRGLSLADAMALGARNGFQACTAQGIGGACSRVELDHYLQERSRAAA